MNGTAVTIARNDHGVYLDTTMTAAESTADPPSVGFEAPSLGSVAEDRFGCCVESGEREFSLTGVSYQGADDALQLAVGLSAGAGVSVTNLVPDLVVESGASAVPLDAWDAVETGSVLYFDLDTLAEHGFAQRFEDGETYPVRILGPWHPQVVDVSVISTPLSNKALGTSPVYGQGDPVRLRVDYDEPVTVTGSPTLRFDVRNIDASPIVETEATATYMAEESTPTGLVFGYTVDAMAALSGTIMLLGDADALSGGAIEAVLARPTATASRFMPEGQQADGQYVYGAAATTPPATATVSVASPGRVSEAAGTLAFPVRLSRARASASEVNYAVTGTATANVDFTGATSGTLTIATGADAGQVMLTLTDDATDEGDETVILTLSSPGTGVMLGSDATAEAVIADNDPTTVTLTAPALAAIDPGGHLFEFEAAKAYGGALHTRATNLETDAAWKLTRSGATSGALEVTVTVSEAGGDFVAPVDEGAHTVTFAKGDSDAYFKIVSDDVIDEGHGTVTVALDDGEDYDVSGAAVATVAVRDDDGALIGYTVDPLGRVVTEGSSAMFEAVLTTMDGGLQRGTFTHPEHVRRAMRSRSGTSLGYWAGWQGAWTTMAADEAVSDEDFTAVAATPALADDAWIFRAASGGVFVRRVPLPAVDTLVNDDGVVGTADDTETIADERLVVSLSAATTDNATTAGRLVPAVRDSIADLTDSDSAVVPLAGADFIAAVVTIREGASITLEIDDDQLAEGDDDAGEEQATITATLDPAATAAFAVTVSATSGDSGRWEFIGANRTLSFAQDATASTGSVILRARHNDVDDDDLEVTVTGTPDMASGLGATDATLTIVDDDLPTVSIAAPDLAGGAGGFVYEGETGTDDGKWTLTRAGLLEDPLEVKVRASESGGSDTDFVAFAADVDQTVTFAATEDTARYSPVTVDTTDEAHGTVTVGIVADPAAYEAFAASATAAADVRDDDAAVGSPLLAVTIDPTALTVREGAAAQLYAVGVTVADGTFTEPAHLARLLTGTGATVLAASADGTGSTAATAGTDYTALAADASATLVFAQFAPAGAALAARAALPAIATTDDGTGDADETFTVTVSLATAVDARIALDDMHKTAEVTLVEGPAVTLALSDDDLGEGETATVTANRGPGARCAVHGDGGDAARDLGTGRIRGREPHPVVRGRRGDEQRRRAAPRGGQRPR